MISNTTTARTGIAIPSNIMTIRTTTSTIMNARSVLFMYTLLTQIQDKDCKDNYGKQYYDCKDKDCKGKQYYDYKDNNKNYYDCKVT